MRALSMPHWARNFNVKRTKKATGRIKCKLKTTEQLIARGKKGVEIYRVMQARHPMYHR